MRINTNQTEMCLVSGIFHFGTDSATTEVEGVEVGKREERVAGVEKITVAIEVENQIGKVGQIHLPASLMRVARMLT